MYEAESVGRIWLDEDSFLAPFGHFEKDYEFVLKYLRDPFIASRTYFEAFDESVAIALYSQYMQVSGCGWIGFYKKERAGFLILEAVSFHPMIYAIHGGLSRKLFGKGYGKKSMDFVKHFVFEEKSATKLEGYILHPNNFLLGHFKRSGLVKECELKDRLLIEGKLSPINIYGLTRENYLKNKEKEDGRFKASSTRSNGANKSTNESSRRRKTRARKKKRFGRRKISKRK